MKPREMVLAQIHHEETATVPYTMGFEGDVADRLNAHYGGTEWRKRLTRYINNCVYLPTTTKEPVEGGLERDPFGSLWRTDRRPFHLEQPCLPKPSFEGYDFPLPEAFRVEGLAEKVRQAKADEPDTFTNVVIGWGLWEHCWSIRGFENALMDCVAEEDFFTELLDRLTDLFLAHVEQVADAPVDAVLFGDDWSDQRGVMIGPERWRKFFKPRWARIYQAVHDQGKLVINHCCGSVVDIMDDLVEIGLDVFESVQPEARGMNPYELKARWGDKITFWGCLGSQSTIPFGTPQEIRSEVARLCREMGRGGGYILAPAKFLQPETPTENAVAVVEAFMQQT